MEHTEELTRAQREDAGPGVEDFLHVVEQARRVREGGRALALHGAYTARWEDAKYDRGRFRKPGNLLDEAAERAWLELDESDRHGRGTVEFLLEELAEVSGAAADAGLAMLVRDLVEEEDFELLTTTWREFGLPGRRRTAGLRREAVPPSDRPFAQPRPIPGHRYIRVEDGVHVRVTELERHEGVEFVGVKAPGRDAEWVRLSEWLRLYQPMGQGAPASS